MAARRNTVLQVRVTDDGASEIDKRRGAWTRSEYVRQALARAVRSNLSGPEPQ